MYGIETDRINFYETRDGKEDALRFVKQTYSVYRKALFQSRKRGFKKPHHASIPEYRLGFILSCLAFRKYIRENKSI